MNLLKECLLVMRIEKKVLTIFREVHNENGH